MYKLVIDGQAGSAKSKVVVEVAQRLRNNGKRVETMNPIASYRSQMYERLKAQGVQLDPTEQYLLVYNEFIAAEKERVYAIEESIREHVRDFEERAKQASTDCIIYDRHWPTMFTQIDDATALTQDEKDKLAKNWIDQDTPPTIFFDTIFDVISKRASYTSKIPWMENQQKYSVDRQRRIDIFKKYRHLHVMDPIQVYENRIDLEPIITRIYNLVSASI